MQPGRLNGKNFNIRFHSRPAGRNYRAFSTHQFVSRRECHGSQRVSWILSIMAVLRPTT